MMILFSLVTSLPAYYVLNRLRIFKQFNILERFVLVLAGSVSVVNLILVYSGLLSPVGIKPMAILLFMSCVILLVLSIKTIVKDVWIFIKSITAKKQYRLLVVLIVVLMIKVVVFYFLRPVIDPDIISQYLTFSRSIAISNRIPAFDSFTLSPGTTPPIGGPALFSFCYLITGDLTSEGFRLLTLPFFIGIITLTYLISKKIFKNTWLSLLVLIVFLSFPIIDNFLLEWALYPDTITTFLQLSLLYFLFFRNRNTLANKNYVLYLILGLSAAEMLLLKTQSLLFFVIVAIMLLVKGKFTKFNTYFIGCGLAIAVLILPLTNLFGFNFFRVGKIEIGSYIMLSLPVIISLVSSYRQGKPRIKIDLVPIVVIGLVTLLGTIALLRNFILYKGYLTPIGTGPYEDMMFQYEIFFRSISDYRNTENYLSYNNIAVLSLPIFGSLYLIPKVVGIIGSFFKKTWNLPILFLTLSYALVLIYSGFPDERYLFAIFPFLAMFVVLGIQLLTDKFLSHITILKKRSYALMAVTLFAIVSLSQSTILIWGFGSQLFSRSELRNIAFSQESVVNTTNPSSKGDSFGHFIGNRFVGLIKLLNTRAGILSKQDVVPSIYLGIAAFLVVLVCTLAFIRMFYPKKMNKFVLMIAFLILVPYIVLYFLMSHSRTDGFSKSVEKNLYNYWGEANVIVPYFNNLNDKRGIVLVVGPQTGLSYKTLMKVYNIEFGYGFTKISSIINEPSIEKTRKYFIDNNIHYVLFYEGTDNQRYLSNFDELSTMSSFIKNKSFFETEIFPDDDNMWRLYKLKTEL